MNYRHLTGPRYDEDCNCHCMEERNTFQQALDNIRHLLDGQTATTLTDSMLDEIMKETDVA